MKLMYDNIVVAKVDHNSHVSKLVLEEGVHEFFIPRNLFLGKSTEVEIWDFYEFIKKRVFPKERTDCSKLLRDLGLSEYKPLAIAEKTKACLMEDGWWVAYSEEDNFRESTIRGAAGFPEWVSASIAKLKEE